MDCEGSAHAPGLEHAAAVWENLDSCSDLGFHMRMNEDSREGGLTSAISDVDSRTRTSWPARRMAIAAPSPPSPAPTTMTWIVSESILGSTSIPDLIGHSHSTYCHLPS